MYYEPIWLYPYTKSDSLTADMNNNIELNTILNDLKHINTHIDKYKDSTSFRTTHCETKYNKLYPMTSILCNVNNINDLKNRIKCCLLDWKTIELPNNYSVSEVDSVKAILKIAE